MFALHLHQREREKEMQIPPPTHPPYPLFKTPNVLFLVSEEQETNEFRRNSSTFINLMVFNELVEGKGSTAVV